MSDSGDLGKLPLEIRNEIYAYLLIEDKAIPIKRTKEKKQVMPARMDGHRNTEHRRKLYDRHQRRWIGAPPCSTSLLLVNKAVNQEATQILYGSNEFQFKNAGALECFLKSIGPSGQHLRHLELMGRGLFYFGSLLSMKRSLSIPQATASLRSLQVSHFALCGGLEQPTVRGRMISVKTLALACAPLLRSLKTAFDKQKLNISIFDVVKIELPPCLCRDHRRYRDYKGARVLAPRHHRRHRSIAAHEYDKTLKCDCLCDAAEAKNKEFVDGLKNEISILLQLDAGQEEHKEGV
jgi:hypothetical protein